MKRPVLVYIPHVAGMCKQASFFLDKLEGFAPHRECPDDLTVIYVGSQHFWASISFARFVEWLNSEEVEEAINLPSQAKSGPWKVVTLVCPTTVPQGQARIVSERRPMVHPK